MNKLVVIVSVFAMIFLAGCSSSTHQNIQETAQQDSISVKEVELTPEEVLAEMEEPTTLGDNLELSIISPEGTQFIPRQARMREAHFDGVEGDKGAMINCAWEFYLNEYDEEVLYKTMDNRSIVNKENTDVCGFTSTFIESRGDLRVVLTATLVINGETLGEYSAERKYRVE